MRARRSPPQAIFTTAPSIRAGAGGVPPQRRLHLPAALRTTARLRAVRVEAGRFQPSRVQRRALTTARRTPTRRYCRSSTARSITPSTCATSRRAIPARDGSGQPEQYRIHASEQRAVAADRVPRETARWHGFPMDELQDACPRFTHSSTRSPRASLGTYQHPVADRALPPARPALSYSVWIAQSRKMATRYSSSDAGLVNGRWQPVTLPTRAGVTD